MAKREDRFNRNKEESNEPKFIEKLVAINRVTKVVKGGRNMRFSALMVMGDGAGMVGIGMGKAAEIPEAIEKAKQAAKRNMVSISMVGTTIPHKVTGVFGRGQVLMMPADEGTGVIAGGPVRTVLEACGIKDIRTKSIGSNTPGNCVKATLEGLKQLRTVEQIAVLRGKQPEDIR